MPRRRKAGRSQDPFEAIWEGLGELDAMIQQASPGSGSIMEAVDGLAGDRRDVAGKPDAEYERLRARDRAAFERGKRKEQGR